MGQQGSNGKAPVWEWLVAIAVLAFMVFAFVRGLDNLAKIVSGTYGPH